MTPVRAAVLGTGRIAVQHLSCLRRLPDVDVVAVCDLSPGRAQAAAERFHVPAWYVDHRRLLERHAPDVVHVTTPPASHVELALDSLAAGAHVFVEKPAAPALPDVERLLEAARDADRDLVESYTYVFSHQVQRILELAERGALGEVVHVDVSLALGITAPGSPFIDPHVRHPALDLPGGPIADFTTHLASLAVAFAGPHRTLAVSSARRGAAPLDADELRALIAGERATATISFSADARPEGLWLRVDTTGGRAVASLFETRLTTERVRPLPRFVESLLNGLQEGRDVAASAVGSALRKVGGGPGSYEGLWTLIGRTYAALAAGTPPPVRPPQILAVNRLVAALADGERRL
jgi:predicted dehydrogenase